MKHKAQNFSVKLTMIGLASQLVFLGIASYGRNTKAPQAATKKAGTQTVDDTSQITVVELLSRVQTRLSKEAARIQIKGKAIQKAEIRRLDALYHSLANLKEISQSLETTSLHSDEGEPPTLQKKPSKAKKLTKPSRKRKR